MKAWKVISQKKVKLEEQNAQSVEDNCVKLKMLNVVLDVAEVDLYRSEPKSPITLGRNGVGMVTEVGKDVTNVKRGDVAYIRPESSCGECANCRSGKRGDCEKKYVYGKTENGVMSDFISVPASDLIVLPKQRISPSEGVYIESVALAISAIGRLNVEKGEHLVIVGATNFGLILAQVALYYQAVPILVDMRADRLKIAEKLGVYYTVNTVESDPVKKIFSITCGKRAESMAYCLLSGMPIQRSFEFLANHGKAVFVGSGALEENLTFNFMPLIAKNVEISSVSNASEHYLSAVNMLASRSVSVSQLIEKKISFDDVGKVIGDLDSDITKYITVVVEVDKL